MMLRMLAYLLVLVMVSTSGATALSSCSFGWDLNSSAAGTDTPDDPWLYHPRFHFTTPIVPGCKGGPQCAGSNDVNGMFEFNGVFHVFYQHKNSNDPRAGHPLIAQSACWSHVASKDLVHWRNFGCSIFSEEHFWAYDGSCTLLDSGPVCLFDAADSDPTKAGKTLKFVSIKAVPSNLSDPWLEHWIIPNQPLDGLYPWSQDKMQLVNPGPGIPAGKSHYVIGFASANNSACHADPQRCPGNSCALLQTDDFTSFRIAAAPETFAPGTDCGYSPIVSPLPLSICGDLASTDNSCTTAVIDGGAGEPPTHLLKYVPYSTSKHATSREVYRLGWLNTSTPSPRWISFDDRVLSLDSGVSTWSHMNLPSQGREGRMFSVGWAFGYATGYAKNTMTCDVLPAVWPTQTVIREVKYDPRLRQLLFLPLPELLDGIRETPAAVTYDFNSNPMVLAAGGSMPLVNDTVTRERKISGSQMQALVYFTRPTPDNSGSNDTTRFGMRVLKNCNLDNCDLFTTVSIEFGTSTSEGTLTVDARRGNSPAFNEKCIDEKSPSFFSGSFKLLSHEQTVELRVLVDRNIVEAFVQGGRAAVSVVVAPNSTTANADVFHGLKEASKAQVKVVNATVNGMGCIWKDSGSQVP